MTPTTATSSNFLSSAWNTATSNLSDAWKASTSFFAGSWHPEQNSSAQDPNAPFNQTSIENSFDIKNLTACNIAAVAWVSNQYLKDNGSGLSNGQLLAAVGSVKGSAYNSKGWLSEPEILTQAVFGAANVLGYMTRTTDYTSLDTLKAANVQYYTEFRTLNGNADRTHVIGWNGSKSLDPDTTTTNRWWTNNQLSTAVYRAYQYTRK